MAELTVYGASTKPIPGWSGYHASNLGEILTEKRGELRPLSPDVKEVEEIRNWRSTKLAASAVAVGERYGISDTQVHNIEKGHQWAERSDWPLPNLWVGTSIELQKYAFRVRVLSEVPAAVRFLSVEPMLGPIEGLPPDGIDWVIVGGESGPGARRMEPEWVRGVVDEAKAAGCSVFVKQLGTVLAGAAGLRGKGEDDAAIAAVIGPEYVLREFPQSTTEVSL